MKKNLKIEKFNNFASNNMIKTRFCYNFLPKEKLFNSFSIKRAKFPISPTDTEYSELNIASANISAIKGITAFRQYFPLNEQTIYRILFYGDDKKVYIHQLLMGINNLSWLYNLTFEQPPIALTFKQDDLDAIILADKEKMVIWKTNYTPKEITDIPVITSMCMNDGVLFCTIQEPAFKIWYASDLDAEKVGATSSTSGYISLDDELGDAKKVVAFDEDVYIIREYGISKINYLQKNITVSQVYASNSRILENTVSVCGNLILFMTFDGLYTFNGTKVIKSDIEIKNLDGINKGAVSSTINHYYFLALRLNFEKGSPVGMEGENYVNNAILVVNTLDMTYQIIKGFDVLAFYPLKTDLFEKLLVVSNGADKDKLFEICFNYNDGLIETEKFWSSEELTDDRRTKLLTSLVVDASNRMSITIFWDDKSATFETYKDGVNSFNFRLACKKIRLEVSSKNKNAELNHLSLEYYEY